MTDNEYKILVVDDNSKNVQLLAGLLSKKNYDVEYSLNGTDALELINSENFDLVLLDIMMPGMDGFEVCEKIKQDERNKDLPIIFITAKTDIESIQKAFKYGGLDYISKPFNIDELLARVKTHLELKASKDKLNTVNKWLEEKVAERTAKLNKANKKLIELDNAKSQFIQIISHEIRTPLNGILGGLSLIKGFELPEESMRFINMLDKSTKRLEDFSYKALDISMFNIYGEGILRPVKSDISEIISNVITNLESFIKSKEITVSQTFEIDNEVTIDAKYFYKCIYNILHNAINYSPNKGLITIEIKAKKNNLIIEIKDEGIGFKEGFVIDEIKPFENKNHIDKNPGLGLFLSNQIVKAHSGFIENGNNANKGAFVKIILPN